MEKVAIKASFQAISKLNCAAYLSQYSDVTVKLPDCPEPEGAPDGSGQIFKKA